MVNIPDIELEDTWDEEDVRRLSCRQLKKKVAEGWDVNTLRQKDGRTLLFDAIHLGRLDLVQTLIKLHADVNKPDKNGDTPLHIAAGMIRPDNIIYRLQPRFLRKNLRILKTLLKANANVNAQNEQRKTPTHIALEYENFEAADILLDTKQLNLFLTDNEGRNYLHKAAEHPRLAMLKKIVRLGIDPCKEDKSGKKAYDIVLREQDSEEGITHVERAKYAQFLGSAERSSREAKTHIEIQIIRSDTPYDKGLVEPLDGFYEETGIHSSVTAVNDNSGDTESLAVRARHGQETIPEAVAEEKIVIEK